MLTPDQEEISHILGRLLSTRDAARHAAEGGPPIDGALWSNLAELGFLGITLPGTHGGVDMSLAEEAIAAEALGRIVAPIPITMAFAAAHILASSATPHSTRLGQALAAGEIVVGAGLSAAEGPAVALTLVPGDSGDDCLISGIIPDMVDGAAIEVVLVPASGRWWSVDLSLGGVTRTEIPSLDPTRRLARVEFDCAPARAVSDFPIRRLMSIVQMLIAAEALGVAQAALDMTRDYSLQREQFGQPIGRFQAVKQKLADCLIAVEGARSALWGAVRSINDGVPDPDAARLAKAQANRAAMWVTGEAVQMHGAIGCTWEHDLHLLMRRAKHCNLTLGSFTQNLRLLGENALQAANSGARSRADQFAGMDLGFIPSGEDEAFIEPFRAWLDENVTAERAKALKRAGMAERRAWQGELADAGWAALHWSKTAGGREASFTQQVLYYAEMTRRGLPPLPGNRGLMLVGPTLIAHGSERQKQLLAPTRRADILWAGGFSERGAGSDLASLRTRGEVDGDELVINGHKIWTSQAQIADWMYALIRTGPMHPKHAGISVVLIPMDSDGLEVRPIRRNNGDYHFNEVFFDNVRVPLDNIVGPMNDGWRINRTTMVGEHLTNFLGSQAAQAETVARIARTIAEREAQHGIDHDLRARFASAWATTQIVKLHGLRNVARFTAGDNPGAEGSISKLVGQENEKELFELMVDAQGASGLEETRWTRAWLSTRASTIGGGTSEIHRNKLAERVLGMPRDPWADDESPAPRPTDAHGNLRPASIR